MISEETLKNWGGETLITHFDRETGAWILMALHSTKRGPSAGGTRMKSYPSFDDAVLDVLKLSKAMTYKFATVDMAWGGGKTVISIPENLADKDREALLLRFGSLIKGLNGKYYAGPDIGTSSEDMDLLYKTAAPYVFSRTVEGGGAGSSSVPTAYGVFAGIQSMCNHLFKTSSLTGKNVLVQGAGNVGGLLIKLLKEAGATVFFNETNPDLIHQYNAEGYTFIEPALIYKTNCDIFSPCAQGGILNSETIPLLKCKGIVGAANNQLATPQDAQRLKDRGILYAPDYITNLGGAMGITAIEAEGLTEEQSFKNVKTSIAHTLTAIFEMAKTNEITTVEAAKKIALNKIAEF